MFHNKPEDNLFRKAHTHHNRMFDNHEKVVRHYQDKSLKQLQELNSHIEAKLNRTKNVALVNELKLARDRHVYKSEYDRIKAQLQDSMLPFVTRGSLQHKKAHYAKMLDLK